MTQAAYLGTFSVNDDKYSVFLDMFSTGGNGLCGFLTGGETAHVGGVAYASPSLTPAEDKITADVSTICGFRHKDIYVAQALAYEICCALNETVSITAGVHVDDAKKEDLQRIKANVSKLAKDFIASYPAS